MLCGSSARFKARMRSSAAGAVLRFQVFHLLLADAVLARAGALHGERPLDQAVDEGLACARLRPGRPCRRAAETWKLPSPTWPTMGAMRPVASMSRLVSVDAFGQPRDRHADVRRRLICGAGPQALTPPNRRRAAPATGACGPRPWSPIRRARRRTRPRSRRSARPAPPRRRPCRGTRGTAVGVSGSASLEYRLRPAPASRRGARSAPPGCPTGS